MLANCPACGRQFDVSDHTEGTQLSCPVCQHAHSVSVPTPPVVISAPQQSIQTKPVPSIGEPVENELPGTADRKPGNDFVFDAGGTDIQLPGRQGRLPTGGTVSLLYMAFVVDVSFSVLMLLDQLTAARYQLLHPDLVGGLLLFMVFLALAPFVLLAAIFLRKLTNWGLVLAGGILAVIIGALAAIAGSVALFRVVALVSLVGDRVPLQYYSIYCAITLFYIIVAMANLFAGIRTLVAIANPAVRRSFR